MDNGPEGSSPRALIITGSPSGTTKTCINVFNTLDGSNSSVFLKKYLEISFLANPV
jgi:hypothetical protein